MEEVPLKTRMPESCCTPEKNKKTNHEEHNLLTQTHALAAHSHTTHIHTHPNIQRAYMKACYTLIDLHS